VSVVTVPWSTVVAVNDHVLPFDSASTAPPARVWPHCATAGSYFTIGYGGNVDLRTIELISREINVVGNLVGSYNDLAELMTLTAQGKVTLHTNAYSLDAVNDAIHDLESGKLVGRGILVPAGV